MFVIEHEELIVNTVSVAFSENTSSLHIIRNNDKDNKDNNTAE